MSDSLQAPALDTYHEARVTREDHANLSWIFDLYMHELTTSLSLSSTTQISRPSEALQIHSHVQFGPEYYIYHVQLCGKLGILTRSAIVTRRTSWTRGTSPCLYTLPWWYLAHRRPPKCSEIDSSLSLPTGGVASSLQTVTFEPCILYQYSS